MPKLKNTEKLIKSKERVKKFAEVYTPKFIVKDMCDLIPTETWNNIESTFLEPCCGNGNFLVEILARKLKLCKNQSDCEKALNSIWAIDIQADNCDESRERMKQTIKDFNFDVTDNVIAILNKNIICGDSLQIMKEWE